MPYEMGSFHMDFRTIAVLIPLIIQNGAHIL